MKKLLYILLSAILAAATACHHRSAASLGDFDISLYAPAYSSGFENFRSGRDEKHDTEDIRPVAGSRRRGNAALHRPQRRTGSGGFSGTGTRRRRPAHRLHVLDLHRHARRPGRTAAGSRRIGHRLHQQPLRRLAQGTDRRRGLRRQHELRAAAFALPGHRAAVRRQRRQRHGPSSANWVFPTPIWASTSNSRRWARPNGSWP